MTRPQLTEQTVQVVKAHLQFNRRFEKLMKALEQIETFRIVDSQSLQHTRLILEHSKARLNLDNAEWLQESELTKCNGADRQLRRLEKAAEGRR